MSVIAIFFLAKNRGVSHITCLGSKKRLHIDGKKSPAFCNGDGRYMDKQILYRLIITDSPLFVIGGTFATIVIAVCVLKFILWALKSTFQAMIKSARRRRYLRSPLSKIDRMKGNEFEQFLAAYFESEGYKVTVTGGTRDYGADLIIKRGGIKTAVQAKRYRNSVGPAAVQQVLGAKGHYHTKNCMVATNSYFTKEAKILARENGVRLWDRDDLLKLKRRV